MKEDLRALVLYRLEQAADSVDSAQILLDKGKCRSSVNRSYYAMFYATIALLAIRSLTTSKHSGVIALFDRDFVKTGLFDKTLSRWLHEAFDLRLRADYREMFQVSPDRARAVLEHASGFVSEVQEQITNLMSSDSDAS